MKELKNGFTALLEVGIGNSHTLISEWRGALVQDPRLHHVPVAARCRLLGLQQRFLPAQREVHIIPLGGRECK